MMRCPKCESLAVADGMSLDYKIKYFTCVNKECGYHFDDIKHQARLNKVLSKMYRKSSGRRYYIPLDKIGLQLDYFVETKTFELYNKEADINLDQDFYDEMIKDDKEDNLDNWIYRKECEISLKTADNLLEDLEVTK